MIGQKMCNAHGLSSVLFLMQAKMQEIVVSMDMVDQSNYKLKL